MDWHLTTCTSQVTPRLSVGHFISEWDNILGAVYFGNDPAETCTKNIL